jgi:hypothetical protein
MAVMRATLTAICVLTLLAVAYLSTSVIILRPPRANLGVWFTLAAFLIGQGALTLAALGTRIGADGAVRATLVASGGIAGVIGAWMVRDTLTSAHFEGYALVLGAMLVAQGVLTVIAFARRLRGRPTVRIA